MTQDLLKMVQSQGYFNHHQRVLLAVSGGADSMSLLHFLYSNQKNLSIRIAIAHVNHKQRPESDSEETYLKDWAQAHAIPFFSATFQGKFSENTARQFRYDFFKQIMQEQDYTALVTAHHADDQAETVMMRLIRGGHLWHLKGISPVRPFAGGELIRPFLGLTKAQLPQVFHFDDSSNQSRTYLRNRIRLDYLPQLTKENPQFSHHLIALSEDISLLKQALDDLMMAIDETHLPSFLEQTPAVQKLLLQNYLEKFPNLQLSRGQFEQVLTYLQSPQVGQLTLKKGYTLDKSAERFAIALSKSPLPLSQPQLLERGQTLLFDGHSVKWSDQMDISDDRIPVWSLSPILIRHRQEGDIIDFGNHRKKLRRLFIDTKISMEDRKKALVAEQNGEIIFIKVAGRVYLKNKPENAILYGAVAIYDTF